MSAHTLYRRHRKPRDKSPRILSAGVIVLRPGERGYKYLVLKAYTHWDFPKGMVEPGETPFEAARREVEEETTITQLDFRWGRIYRETRPYNRGRKVARYYIAETRQQHVDLPVNPDLGRPEHSAYRWVERDVLWGMVTSRLQSILIWADGVMCRPTSRQDRANRPKSNGKRKK